MPELATGTIIDGRYRVLSRLGAGGMADVFCAEDQQLGRKVALKLLHRRFAEDPDFVERFRREAQAAAGLQHPNVVGVYDRGAYDGTYYIAMEYLPGHSLKQLIRQEAPLDPVRAIDITIQILKAARFAHKRGVIHRDLKPHNVIIDESDNAKVTDFGIARAGASDMTETGSIMGTAQYLSPEQAQGHAVSAASDLYAVGVVLYELLTGRVPFDGESAVTIALKHVSEAPPAPRAINPAIPPELEQAVLWALNKNPSDRPADAEQFIDVLERIKEQILAGSRGERTSSFAAVGDVPPTVLAEDGVPAVLPVPLAEDEELPPEERGRRWWPWLVALLVLLLAGGAAAYLLTRPAQKVVPLVVGESLNIATTNVQNAGFQPSIINVPNSKPAGTVIAQNPPAGSKADEGSTITLKVSQGPGNTTVPSVTGLSQDAAKRKLRHAHLKVSGVQTESSTQIASGDVVKTDPGVGQQVLVGSSVTLFISSGPPKATVPDVTGQSESSARSTLQNAGFSVGATTHQTTTSAQAGTVISQSPVGGSVEPRHSSVALTIAQAPTLVSVPDVTGDSKSAAISALRAAGFQVSTSTQNVHQQSKDGTVVSQSPSGGSKAKKGSTVSIVIGQFTSTTTSPTTPTTTTPTTPTTTTTT